MTSEKKKATRKIPIALKLSLMVVSILVPLTAIQGWVIANQQSRLLEQEIRKFGEGTTQLLVRQVNEPLLSQDELTLGLIVQSAIKHKGIAGVEIRSRDGNKVSGSGAIPLGEQPQIGQPRAWLDDEQNPFLSYVAPAYSNNLKVGEVLVTFHTDTLYQVKREARRFIIYSTLFLLVAGIVISTLISTVVTTPIRRLINISQRIAAGDYQAQFSKKRNDELGILIGSLDVMTKKLLHKIHVEQTFSRYVSPKVAKEVLTNLAPQELGGKEVTSSVLFADIVGFTSISETMAAHEVSQLLNDYFTYIDQAAYQCDGHVDKYMGDCAMLLFGVPEAQTEHDTNAIYCALLIHRIVEYLNSERAAQGKATIVFKIGVNSGTMLAGNMGSRYRMEYTVLGDTVNTASRLTSSAGQGEVAITETLASQTQVAKQFVCEQGETITLKGKQNPVMLYRVQGGNEEIEERLERDIGIVISNVETNEISY